MKHLYFFFFVLFSLSFQAQIINIPDANFKAKLLEANTTNNIASSTYDLITPIVIDINGNNEIEVSEVLQVRRLDVSNSSINSLEGIEYFSNIRDLICNNNSLSSLEVSNLNLLKKLNCSFNQLTSLNFDNIDNLIERLDCTNNLLTSLDVNNLLNLIYLNCSHNLLTTLNSNSLYNTVINFDCSYNNLTSIRLPTFRQWTDEEEPDIFLKCSHNNLSEIFFNTASYGQEFSGINLSNNNFSSLTFPVIYPDYLDLSNNPLTYVNLENVVMLSDDFLHDYVDSLIIENTYLTELYIPFNIMDGSSISNNPYLVHLNIKNGKNNLFCYYEVDENGDETGNIICNGITINNNPQLVLVCCDIGEINYYSGNLPSNVQVSEYCNYTPGGEYKTLTGNIKLDINNDGCDSNDISSVNLPIIMRSNTGFFSGSTFTDNQGNFSYYIPSDYTNAYNKTFTPYFQNSYYTVSPVNYTYNYNTANDTEMADFCILPNGIHPDLDISIFPVTPARPGFDTVFKIVYKNKGTETQSGSVIFTFPGLILDFVNSIPRESLRKGNTVNWDFTDLQPFESREIEVTLNVNAPTETPPVNNGDILTYSTNITSLLNDETPNDNLMDFNQIVVGSFDPNDKSVSKTQLPIDQIDDYLYYTIRFQNTGTFAAENIVLKDILHYSKLDLASLKVVSSSHQYRASLTSGNKFEVFYEYINLPPSIENEQASHGYFTFKIKPKSTVVVNDVIENKAEIFFDYNFPIVTNTVATTITMLSNDSFSKDEIKIYPNPTTSILNIQSEIEISNIVITNMLGQKLLSNRNQSTIDVSSLSKGTYFITIQTDNGKQTQKFIKH